MEHSRAFVCASRKLHIEGSAFDFAAHGDCFALVDLLAGIVADELDLLGVIVYSFIHDHDIALRRAVLKIGRSVHADVDHALRDLFVQLLSNFFRAEIVPAALDGAGIVDDTGLTTSVFFGQRLADQTGDKKNARANGTDEKCDSKHNADIEPCLFWMILIYFVHGNSSFVFCFVC